MILCGNVGPPCRPRQRAWAKATGRPRKICHVVRGGVTCACLNRRRYCIADNDRARPPGPTEALDHVTHGCSTHSGGDLEMLKIKLLSKLFVPLMEFIEHDPNALKNIKVIHKSESWATSAYPLLKIFKHIDADTVWTVTTAYGKGALCSIAIMVFIMAIYLLKNSPRWRRARVFVSYQHMFEDIATAIVERLRQNHLHPIKLPFVQNQEHDALLDNVTTGIRESDLVVCIPGEARSFVENEIAMALVLKKPLMFVSTNDYLGRIPDTAKRGYPVINLNSLDEG